MHAIRKKIKQAEKFKMKILLDVSIELREEDRATIMTVSHAFKQIGQLELPGLKKGNETIMSEQRQAMAGLFLTAFSAAAQNMQEAEIVASKMKGSP